MKLKKLLISASVIAASSGLLATVLTSCAKANIDKDQKIDLDPDGKFVDEILAEGTSDFRKAAAKALQSPSTWKTFKEALANEIIYKWYENRSALADSGRNKDFKTFIENKKFRIDDDYNNKVDSYKSKYGANHQFYLQNEVLSPNGGTVDAYKHSQLVSQIKDEFINNVFRFNYFSMGDGSTGHTYPHIFTPAETSTFNPQTLNNPANWKNIGFFAKANKSFPVIEAETDMNQLAIHPDGDYAIIQNYVFNRWFETEKPFFSAAALFKYNKPADVGTAMTDLYSNKATVPDAPNEAFPFFGTASSQPEPSNGFTGQRAFWRWHEAFNKGEFTTQGVYTDSETNADAYNGSISIPTKYSEDGQTLLLSYASRMIDGDKTLYVPYAISAASLYNQMLGQSTATDVINTLKQSYLEGIMPDDEPYPTNEDPLILKLFFFDALPASEDGTIGSSLDLYSIYNNVGGLQPSATVPYHCPLFVENNKFTFFYGDTKAGAETNGVRYITNNVQIELQPTLEGSEITYTIPSQPWVFELNEAGMHAQTIDGYSHVYSSLGTGALHEKYRNGSKALKEVLMFRLLQHQAGWDDGTVSANVFGSDSGDLFDYFKKNYADIVLEMAFAYNQELNVFRDIASYVDKKADSAKIFFNNVCKEQGFYHGQSDEEWTDVRAYIKATQEADLRKSFFDDAVNTSKKIYSYRATQVSNSKNDVGSNKVFENGLLAPLVVKYETNLVTSYESARHYTKSITFDQSLYFNVETSIDTATLNKGYMENDVTNAYTAVSGQDFIEHIDGVAKDSTDAFSAQIVSAKAAQSNRYWYKSPIVDKMMYTFLDSNALANEIKGTTYSKYNTKVLPQGTTMEEIENLAKNEITSVYKAKKVLTTENNFAYYSSNTADYFNTISSAYTRYCDTKTFNDGETNDEWLNFKLFEATLAYLVKDTDGDGKYFDNFYSSLESAIKDGERAYIGYITKFNTYDPFQEDLDKVSSTANNPYLWKANAANIYDDFHYAGNAGLVGPTRSPLRGDFEQYWNVIKNKFSTEDPTPLGGFVGLQTLNDNDLDKDSGMQDAAFGGGSSPFSHHVYKTKSIDKTTVVAENTGVWYPWAGSGGETEGTEANPYYFDPIVDPTEEQRETKTFKMFDALPEARKLACKFAKLSSPEDIRALSGKIGKELHNQDNIFTKIASGERPYLHPATAAAEMKYDILDALLSNDGTVYEYKTAFARLENVELRASMWGDFCFEKGTNEGYKFMFTQVNLADVKERLMSPAEIESTTMPEGSPLTLNEFWYILADFAMVNSIQQNAMKDAINTVFEGKKLIVHDAQLYNKFDATWIKDWVKKPMGE